MFIRQKNSPSNRRVCARVVFEQLEMRTVPTVFGLPWSDPANLSLSFVPDGTRIANHTSALFQTLNAQMDTEVWQREVARAFQRWARVTNLDVRIRPDSGLPIGAAGLTPGDPRFGDIRVAAHAMAPDALALAVPYDPAGAGTMAGDVFLNRDITFNGSPYNLFTILLHEAGHVLGLGHSNDPGSPMYAHFNNQKEDLTLGDIAAIQALYGVRAHDAYEGAFGNDEPARAANLPQPSGYVGATPLVVFADMNNDDDDNADVDYFRFRVPSGYRGAVTVRLQTAGVSVLAPRILLLNAHGDLLGEAETQAALGDVLTINLPSSRPTETYYIRVDSGNDDDDFDTGGYALSVRFDGLSSVTDASIDTLLRGPHKSLSANEIAALFLAPATTFFNSDEGAVDSMANAVVLASQPGYTPQTRYQAVASIHKKSDRDFYRITTPAGTAGVLTATIWTNDARGLLPRVRVLNAAGKAVAANVLASDSGTYRIQVPNALPNAVYYVVASAARYGGVGNYYLGVDIGKVASPAPLQTSGALSLNAPVQMKRLYVARTQWFHFVLRTAGLPKTASILMTVHDKHQNLVLQIGSRDFASGAALIIPGEYTVRFQLLDAPATWTGQASYKLHGRGISDPVGPVTEDPTMQPMYGDPSSPNSHLYPDGTRTPQPYHWVALAL